MIREYLMRFHKQATSENGAEVIEFLALLPLVLGMALVAFQFIIAAHTAVVSISAAREGARALAVCDGNPGNATTAAKNAAPGYPGAQIACNNPSPGGQVNCEARLRLPLVLGGIFKMAGNSGPEVIGKAAMMKERCPW